VIVAAAAFTGESASIWNLAVDWPGAAVRVAGMRKDAFELARFTSALEESDGFSSLTRQTPVAPRRSNTGSQEIDVSRVRTAVLDADNDEPEDPAWMVTVVDTVIPL
jgi:hypothetical protein